MAPKIIAPYRKEQKPYEMPTAEDFLKMKKRYCPKKDPEWVKLEKQMKAKEAIKPYNNKVGIWCKFLKDFKTYQYCQLKKHLKQIDRECGPSWFCEFSFTQRKILGELPRRIKDDIIVKRPYRVRDGLTKLGITLKIPPEILLKAMENCRADHGVFIWNLYTAIYKESPSVLRKSYDMNAKLLMSSLVFIDLEECIDTFNEITRGVPEKPKSKKKKQKPVKKNPREDKQYGLYLKTEKVPLVILNPDPKPKKPPKVDYLFQLRTEQMYEKLRMNTDFLEKRKERKTQRILADRVCDYKFATPRMSTKGVNPKEIDLILKMRMLTLKANMRQKDQAVGNTGFLNTGVSYTGNVPRYIISTVIRLPTPYMHVAAGYYMLRNQLGIVEFLPIINGYWKPKLIQQKKTCDRACDCLALWEKEVMEHTKQTRCRCHHLFDSKIEGKPLLKVVHKPTKYGPMWIDDALMYELDPTEEFIKTTVKKALKSSTSLAEVPMPTLRAEEMKPKDVLIVLLADLAHSPLIIPHLPKAYKLNNLHAWVRKRLHGKVSPEQTRSMWLHAQRRWLQLGDADFRARAYMIPFLKEHLANFNWSYRYELQDMFEILLEDIKTRSRRMQLEQTRLWWSTMNYDDYPSKSFLDTFFALSPGRMMDAYILNPYNRDEVRKVNPKPCGRK